MEGRNKSDNDSLKNLRASSSKNYETIGSKYDSATPEQVEMQIHMISTLLDGIIIE